jgi:excisionase family DNA binding protein
MKTHSDNLCPSLDLSAHEPEPDLTNELPPSNKVQSSTRESVSVSSSTKFEQTFEPLLNIEESASMLGGIHPKTLQRMARKGEIPGYQIAHRWYFRASDLDAWLKSRLNSNRQSIRMNGGI